MTDDDIARAIEALISRTTPEGSVCPSEVARALDGNAGHWRALMPEVRRVAAALARAGVLRATRGKLTVDPLAPGGPIRLRRP